MFTVYVIFTNQKGVFYGQHLYAYDFEIWMKPSLSYNIDLSSANIMPGFQAITIDTPPEILLKKIW